MDCLSDNFIIEVQTFVIKVSFNLDEAYKPTKTHFNHFPVVNIIKEYALKFF